MHESLRVTVDVGIPASLDRVEQRACRWIDPDVMDALEAVFDHADVPKTGLQIEPGESLDTVPEVLLLDPCHEVVVVQCDVDDLGWIEPGRIRRASLPWRKDDSKDSLVA
jgi:hypothetical protein